MCPECLAMLQGHLLCQPFLLKHCQEAIQSSNNEEIDAILQSYQSSISDFDQIWEFIPFENLNVIEQIGEGGFGKVSKAQWINGGPIESWDVETKSWKREEPPEFVALKVCDNLENFINEVSPNFFALPNLLVSNNN